MGEGLRRAVAAAKSTQQPCGHRTRQLKAVNDARVALCKLIARVEWHGNDRLFGEDNKAAAAEGVAALDQLVEAFA